MAALAVAPCRVFDDAGTVIDDRRDHPAARGRLPGGVPRRRAGGAAGWEPVDPGVVWLEPGGLADARLVWPVGSSARFSPRLEILDRDGKLLMSEGEPVSGACLKGPANDPGRVLMIEGSLVPRGAV